MHTRKNKQGKKTQGKAPWKKRKHKQEMKHKQTKDIKNKLWRNWRRQNRVVRTMDRCVSSSCCRQRPSRRFRPLKNAPAAIATAAAAAPTKGACFHQQCCCPLHFSQKNHAHIYNFTSYSALWTCITCRLKDTSTRATHESVSVTWSNLRMHGSYVCCLVMPWSIQVMQGNVHKFRTKHVALQRNFHPNANHCGAMPIPTRLFASIWAPSCTRKA